MKKILILLFVATLPLASGCCCARLCPFCPCNWFNRGAYCPPATYAAPLAASPCGPTYVPSPYAASPCSTCGPTSPLAATVMPQYFAPQAASMMTQSQPMYYQQPASACCPTSACCAPEPSCGYAAEPGCGGPYMGNVSYGPMMDCGPCNSCDNCSSYGGGGSSNCDGGMPVTAPTPEKFVDPAPATE